MAGLYSDASLELAFQMWLDETLNVFGQWYLALYENNFTPVVAQVPGDFTPPTVGGYAPEAEPLANWTITTTATGAQAVMVQKVWSFTGAVTLYGYYLVDGGDLVVLGAELFAGGPITFGAGGGTLTLDVTLILNTP